MVLDRLRIPIVQAPMAGGSSTPELAAAVSDAGALGFVAAGYKAPDAMRADIAATRALTSEPFGVNVFAARPTTVAPAVLGAFADRVRSATRETGVAPGEPRSDDDGFDAKVALLLDDPPAVVSFVFGCPPAGLVHRLHEAGCEVWVTTTDVDEARTAAATGADALVAQGVEAGGHRGSFDDEHPGDLGLLALLQLTAAAVDLPLVASGGIATGAGVAAALAAGASAAQIGTAFMACDEAATSDVHRRALTEPGRTALTRAFTGRMARGIVNRFLAEHSEGAPRAYPAVHHLTAPIRAHARRSGDPELLNLWAGQAHELTRSLPAAELVRALHEDARSASARVARRLGRRPPTPDRRSGAQVGQPPALAAVGVEVLRRQPALERAARGRPLAVEQREPRGVAVAALDDHVLAERALVGEAEALGGPARARVGGVALPLQAAVAEVVEGVAREQVDRLGRGRRALQRGAEPHVADLDDRVARGDAQEALAPRPPRRSSDPRSRRTAGPRSARRPRGTRAAPPRRRTARRGGRSTVPGRRRAGV